MVGLSTSCDQNRLKKIMSLAYLVMSAFYGLTREDKEDIMLDVMYRFEVDKGRFPDSVYARHCRNKVIGFLDKKTAQKRMARKIIDGKIVYIPDVSLNKKVGKEKDAEYGSLIPAKDTKMEELEFLTDMERRAPSLVPLFKKVLDGQALTTQEKKHIKSIISREDLVE